MRVGGLWPIDLTKFLFFYFLFFKIYIGYSSMTLYHAVMCLVEYAIIINDNDIVKIKLFIRHTNLARLYLLQGKQMS